MRHTISMRTSHLPYYRSQSDTYRAAPTGDSQYTCTLCGKMSCRLFGTLAGYEHTSSSPSFRIWSHSVCLQVDGSPSYMAPDKVGIHISCKKSTKHVQYINHTVKWAMAHADTPSDGTVCTALFSTCGLFGQRISNFVLFRPDSY